MRTLKELLEWDSRYVHHPTFDDPASASYLNYEPVSGVDLISEPVRLASGLSSFLQQMCQHPILTHNGERSMFLKYNYAKMSVSQLQKVLRCRPDDADSAAEADRLIDLAINTRNAIATYNIRLVIYACRNVKPRGTDMEEAVSHGSMILLKCINSFDVGRINRRTNATPKFSTYVYCAIRKSLWRSFMPDRKRLPTVGIDATDIEIADVSDHDLDRRLDDAEQFERLMAVIGRIGQRNEYVLRRRYGLGMPSATLDEVGHELGINRERVRQIQLEAIRKLSEEACRHHCGPPRSEGRLDVRYKPDTQYDSGARCQHQI